VRDPALTEALRRLAAEAATRFSSLVASGDEIPFDVAEDAGPDSLFYRYVPLTARYVGERADEVRSLPAFEPAREAVAEAAVAAPYLEARGRPVPEDEGTRAEAMLLLFVAALWDGSTDFALDRPRLDRALDTLDAETRELDETDMLIVPLVGLRMSAPRISLPSGVRIVRADSIEVPLEAMRSEGMNREPWEPQFLAVAEQDAQSEDPVEALRQLHELISVMRLFKEGAIGLGPHAFAPTGDDSWRRIATGAPPTRPGSYELSEAETAELAEFAGDLEACPDPRGSLAWAIARFEMGCERASAIEGLSDHLLALQAVLEGEGPVGASLPMRAAALIAEPDERPQTSLRFERIQHLERALIAGAPVGPAGLDAGAAADHAAWLEEGLRAILRDAALGEHGADLGAAADETLIAAGLIAGEVSEEQMGSAAEWDVISEVGENADREEEIRVTDERDELLEREARAGSGEEIRVTAKPATEQEFDRAVGASAQEGLEAGPPEVDEDLSEEAHDDGSRADPGDDYQEGTMIDRDWLGEVERADSATLEWPATAIGEPAPGERERIDTPRVRHLFPVPEDADWEVRELDYDRRKTANGR
jgi:hypothetical protein